MGMNQDESKFQNKLIEELFLRIKGDFGDNAIDFVPLIELVSTFKGSRAFFKDALGFKNTQDCIAQLRFALYFHQNGYIVEFIPRSKEKTPDLFVTNSELRGFVEIKHIHKKHDGPKKMQINDSDSGEILEEYGNYIRDEKYCRDKIIEGFKQLRNFPELKKTDWMIVAVWNSDEDLDEIDMESSLNLLIHEQSELKNIPNPKCIIYGSNWLSLRKNTEFHSFCF